MNTLNNENTDALIDRWAQLTVGLSDEGPHLPVNVILGEAVDVAEAIEAHMSSYSSKGKTVPGLSSFLSAGGLTEHTSTELRELEYAANTVDSRYYNLVQADEGTTVEDAEAIIRELRMVLSFALEDGQHPTGEAQLTRLRDKEEEHRSQDGVALVLDHYRELAREHLQLLKTVPDFDPAVVDQAIATSQGLRQRSADALNGNNAREQRELLSLRNRLLTAISDRLREARRVFRYVFRDHPDIVKKATSNYSRDAKRRADRAGSSDSSSASADSTEVTQVPMGATS